MVAKTHSKKFTNAPRRTPEVIAKQAEAVKLKVAGETYESIARTLGYADHTGAMWAVRAGLAARLDASGTEELRALEAERLEQLHQSRWPKAVSGDDDAYGLVLQTMKQRATLLGLNAPVEHKVTGDPNSPVTVELKVDVSVKLKELSDDELVALRSITRKFIAGPVAGG